MKKVFKRTAAGVLVAASIAAGTTVIFDDGKTFTAPPRKGAIEREFDKKRGKMNRRSYKATVLKNVIFPKKNDNEIFSYKGIDFELANESVVDGNYKVYVYAKKDGEKLRVDNPLFFQNPPFKVPDGTFHKETLPTGEIIDVKNFKEDPEAALKEIIYQTVASQNNL
jgi:hypothetical protein